MPGRMIWAIFRKDLRETVRDGRVLLAVLLPLGLGIFYNLIFDEEPLATKVRAAAVYAAEGSSRLPEALRQAAGSGGALEAEVTPVDDGAAVRRAIAEEEAELGIVIPAGFDAAVAEGAGPPLDVLTPAAPGAGSAYLLAALDDALRQMAGQPEPAVVRSEAVPAAGGGLVFERVGLAPYFVVTNVVFVVVMVALFAVPVILTEETEKRTLDAVTLIASYLEVVVAKALVGFAFIAIAVGALLALTRVIPAEPAALAGVVAVLAATLIGFGLLMGGIFRSVTQLNTWSSFVLLPFAMPIFAVGLPLPAGVEWLLAALPTSQATRLALDAVAGEAIFGGWWLGLGVIAGWGVLAYAVLLWRLSRREG